MNATDENKQQKFERAIQGIFLLVLQRMEGE